jgi:hypothetical protein
MGDKYDIVREMDTEPTRQERREDRRRNGRKMQVSGRSVLLLANLNGVSRRRIMGRGKARRK